MNNIHQVIFSKSTQQFVVVSELAKSVKKPKAVSASSEDIISILQNFSEKQPLGTTDTQTNRSDNKSSSWSVGGVYRQIARVLRFERGRCSKCRQTEPSGSGSLALGANGLNGGVSAQFSQNKAKVDIGIASTVFLMIVR